MGNEEQASTVAVVWRMGVSTEGWQPGWRVGNRGDLSVGTVGTTISVTISRGPPFPLLLYPSHI